MSIRRRIMTAVGAIPLGATMLVAQGWQRQQALFEWTGRVDREVLLTMRGDQVWTRAIGSDDGSGRSRVEGMLPRADGDVAVQVERGRGQVDVVQQPTARNGYTTIVRIADPQGGADRYRVSAYWEPAYGNGGYGGYGRGNGGVAPRGRDGNGGWHGRDDDDRDGDRDRDRDHGRRGRDDGGYGANGGYGNNGGYGSNGGYGAGGAGTLHWSGQVDDEVEIRVQGRRAMEYDVRGNGTRGVRADISGQGLPQRDAQLWIGQAQGRGSVTIVQQPSARNDYTAVIRIKDPQGGFGYYDFDLSWR